MRKKYSKILGALICVVLGLSVTACGNGDSGNTDDSKAVQEEAVSEDIFDGVMFAG